MSQAEIDKLTSGRVDERALDYGGEPVNKHSLLGQQPREEQ
jgi:hypothetical protein